MVLSRDRILTTHVGSLPRGEAISELLIAREAGDNIDQAKFDAEMDKRRAPCRRRSRKRPASISAMTASSSASASRPICRSACPASAANRNAAAAATMRNFPNLLAMLARRFPRAARIQNAPEAQAEIHYLDDAADQAPRSRGSRRAVTALDAFPESFMTAPSPGISPRP